MRKTNDKFFLVYLLKMLTLFENLLLFLTAFWFQFTCKSTCFLVQPKMLQNSRCTSSKVLAILLSVFLLICCIISSAYGQVNNELDEPFMLRNGEPYRDKLTIASGKAVAEFAKRYQHRQDFRVGMR